MRLGLVLIALLGLLSAAPSLAQQSPESFTLYFDLGSARPSRTSEEIVARAAESAQRRATAGRLDHVKVIGYADTSGAAKRSQRLSEERADAVKRLLVERGLPADKVRTEGRGKRSLAVATADRVRESRNRRTRIVLYGPGE